MAVALPIRGSTSLLFIMVLLWFKKSFSTSTWFKNSFSTSHPLGNIKNSFSMSYLFGNVKNSFSASFPGSKTVFNVFPCFAFITTWLKNSFQRLAWFKNSFNVFPGWHHHNLVQDIEKLFLNHGKTYQV